MMKRWVLGGCLLLLCSVTWAAEKPAPANDAGWGVPLFAGALANNDWLVCRQRCDTAKHGCFGKDAKNKDTETRCNAEYKKCQDTCDRTYKH